MWPDLLTKQGHDATLQVYSWHIANKEMYGNPVVPVKEIACGQCNLVFKYKKNLNVHKKKKTFPRISIRFQMWWMWKNLPIEEQFDKTRKSTYNLWINTKLICFEGHLNLTCSVQFKFVFTWYNCPHLSSLSWLEIIVLSWYNCPHYSGILISPYLYWIDYHLLSGLVQPIQSWRSLPDLS